jgi:hypothetical protein
MISRGELATSRTISALREAFPQFSERWTRYIESWGGKPPGSYLDMAEFVHFVVEDLYEKRSLDETRRAFQVLDKLFVEGDQSTRDLVGFGFFETLPCVASWQPYGSRVFEEFLGPMSKQVWNEIQRKWAGKSNLMDVIRAERKNGRKNA